MCDAEYRMQILIFMNSMLNIKIDNFISSIVCREILRNISDMQVVFACDVPKFYCHISELFSLV
jgi:hypothetical protein